MQSRMPTQTEWNIVSRVFGDTLPFRQRIQITDQLGAGGAPFTIPTSAASTAVATVLTGAAGGLAGYLGSAVNLGYLINVGPHYPDLTATPYRQELLVHEMAHVWQGKNSFFSLTYVADSAVCQGLAMASSMSGLGGRSGAYSYTIGQDWHDYNSEQQAEIIEEWFKRGEPTGSDDHWPYIRDFVRKGKA